MLLVGDSMAELLGTDWQHLAPHYALRLYNYGIIGCGLTTTGEVKIKDQVFSDRRAAAVKCGNWPKYWANEISTLRPQVAAMLFGPFEIRDHLVNGQWIHIGTPAFDKLERAHLQQAVSVLSMGGAKVVFFTSPYYDEGEQLDGSPWPADDPARVNRLNKLLREVAATHPGTVRVIISAVICHRVDIPRRSYEALPSVPPRILSTSHRPEPQCWRRSSSLGSSASRSLSYQTDVCNFAYIAEAFSTGHTSDRIQGRESAHVCQSCT